MAHVFVATIAPQLARLSRGSGRRIKLLSNPVRPARKVASGIGQAIDDYLSMPPALRS
jgi:hypothetical protein